MKTRYLALLIAGMLAASPMAYAELSAAEQQAKEQAKEQARADREARRARDAEARKEARRTPTDDEALALAALEGLMSMSADKSLPILKRVLSGGQSNLVKGRALFVVSQIGAPEAQQVLLDFARQPNNALRAEAIRNIGIGGQPTSLAALKDIYNGGDEITKQDVLQAWQIAGRRAEVYQVALAAKTDAEADRAIMVLSTMGAREELRKLSSERKHSNALMDAFAISGDLQSLKRIADSAPDAATRVEAVRKMGILGSQEARSALRDTYHSATDAKVKSAALSGLQIAGDQRTVLDLYKAAKTPEEKRLLLRTLSMMGGEAALEAIDRALGEKK